MPEVNHSFLRVGASYDRPKAGITTHARTGKVELLWVPLYIIPYPRGDLLVKEML